MNHILDAVGWTDAQLERRIKDAAQTDADVTASAMLASECMAARGWSAGDYILVEPAIMSNTLVMLPRNNRAAVFHVKQICSASNPLLSYPTAIFTSQSRVVMDAAIALHATYSQLSALKQPFAAYDDQAKILVDTLRSSFGNRKMFERLGVQPIRGVYITGPHGIGKKTLALHAVCNLAKVPLICFHISEELQSIRRSDTKGNGDVLTPLKKAIFKALLVAPSVLLIAEMGLLADDTRFTDVNRYEMATHVARLLQIIKPSSGVCIIAPVVNVERLPESLRPKRIDAASGFQIFGENAQMLCAQIAQRTVGYVAKDLVVLMMRAAFASELPRQIPVSSIDRNDDLDDLSRNLEKLSIDANRVESSNRSTRPDMDSLEKWMSAVQPSQLSNIGFDTTKRYVEWDSIGGYSAVKKKLQQIVTWPRERADVFSRLGIKPTAGVLLYGPSGRQLHLHRICG
eukprot:jgi/Hompol1/5987/HPOL_000152-RA